MWSRAACERRLPATYLCFPSALHLMKFALNLVVASKRRLRRGGFGRIHPFGCSGTIGPSHHSIS